jgi:hypothetical protein
MIVLGVGSTRMAAGDYEATVHVTCETSDAAPRTIEVVCSITSPDAPPRITLSPSAVSFGAEQNGALPESQSVRITNGGNGTLTGLALDLTYDGQNSSTAWLRMRLTRSTAPATVVLDLASTALNPGTYTARVTVSTDMAGVTSRTIQVTCVITSPSATPRIELSPTAVSFEATAGGADPVAQSVAISNSGTGTLNGLDAEITYPGGQPTGWLSRSLGSTVAPATLTLRASTAGLGTGTYHATVTVSSPVTNDGPRTVSVTLNVASSQPTTGSIKVNVVTGGQNIDPTGYVVSVTVVGNLVRTTNVNTNGYVVFSDLAPGAHTVELEDIAANCIVGGANPRTVNVIAGMAVETTFDITCNAPPARRVTIVNNINAGLFLEDIVQVKVASNESSVFTRDDLLTEDPGRCMSLPGEAVGRGQSITFDVALGDSYSVFIGVGTWDLDNYFCSLGRNWFKRTYFTDPGWNNHYVWVVVNVTGHQAGDWEWVVSGSYLNGTLKVTPAGNAGLPFHVTPGSPIP